LGKAKWERAGTGRHVAGKGLHAMANVLIPCPPRFPGFSLLLTPQASFSPLASPSHITFPFIYWSFGFSLSPSEHNRRDSDRGAEERDPKIKHIQGLSMAPCYTPSNHPYSQE